MVRSSGKSSLAADSSTELVIVPPDGGYGWVIVLAAFLIHIIVDGIAFTFGVLSTELEAYFEAGSGKTNLVGSVLSGTYLLSAPLASVLIHRFGCRLVSILGALIATLGFGVASFARSIDVLLLTYGVIGGLGLGLLYLPAVISVSFYFEKRRGLTTGIVVCGTGVGCFLMAPLFAYLLTTWGWRYCLVILACITLNGCVAGALLRPLKPTRVPRLPNELDRSPDTNVEYARRASVTDATFARRRSSVIAPSSMHLPQDPAFEALANERRRKSSVIPSDSLHLTAATLPADDSEGKSGGGGCQSAVSKAIKLDLWKDPLFFIPCLANLFAMLGIFIPFFFINHRAMLLPDADAFKAAFLLSVIGWPRVFVDGNMQPVDLAPSSSPFRHFINFITRNGFVQHQFLNNYVQQLQATTDKRRMLIWSQADVSAITNTSGRILMGFLADLEHVSALLLHNVAIVTAGVTTIFSMFCLNYPLTCLYAAVFGLCIATWMSLTSVILCELLGLEKLTDAFGLLTMARGISSLVGPPIAGMVYDATKNYNNSFHVGGVFLLAGGLISCVLHLPSLQKKKFHQKR